MSLVKSRPFRFVIAVLIFQLVVGAIPILLAVINGNPCPRQLVSPALSVGLLFLLHRGATNFRFAVIGYFFLVSLFSTLPASSIPPVNPIFYLTCGLASISIVATYFSLTPAFKNAWEEQRVLNAAKKSSEVKKLYEAMGENPPDDRRQ